jgi:hypothetical protein
MIEPISTVSTRSTSTAGSSHRGSQFTQTAYKPADETRSEVDPWVTTLAGQTC